MMLVVLVLLAAGRTEQVRDTLLDITLLPFLLVKHAHIDLNGGIVLLLVVYLHVIGASRAGDHLIF